MNIKLSAASLPFVATTVAMTFLYARENLRYIMYRFNDCDLSVSICKRGKFLIVLVHARILLYLNQNNY